ncbi:hypothetical protein E2C01_008687 [Portunus trituberculatus]|uniref:Uncharacterized protein n=1 Tax=Portunus trituberculatus TaxID=210409 RepID=A0A5B7D1F6_PORTR|nr:hypothetical protein [Portunus trituberculatus]
MLTGEQHATHSLRAASPRASLHSPGLSVCPMTPGPEAARVFSALQSRTPTLRNPHKPSRRQTASLHSALLPLTPHTQHPLYSWWLIYTLYIIPAHPRLRHNTPTLHVHTQSNSLQD